MSKMNNKTWYDKHTGLSILIIMSLSFTTLIVMFEAGNSIIDNSFSHPIVKLLASLGFGFLTYWYIFAPIIIAFGILYFKVNKALDKKIKGDLK